MIPPGTQYLTERWPRQPYTVQPQLSGDPYAVHGVAGVAGAASDFTAWLKQEAGSYATDALQSPAAQQAVNAIAGYAGDAARDQVMKFLVPTAVGGVALGYFVGYNRAGPHRNPGGSMKTSTKLIIGGLVAAGVAAMVMGSKTTAQAKMPAYVPPPKLPDGTTPGQVIQYAEEGLDLYAKAKKTFGWGDDGKGNGGQESPYQAGNEYADSASDTAVAGTFGCRCHGWGG